MFVHDINSVLLGLGPVEIRYYGLVYALGFLLIYLLLAQAANKKTIPNLGRDNADVLTLYLVAGLIIGARVLDFLFYNPQIFLTYPLEVLMIWHGGLSFHGGVIGATAAALLFCRKYQVKFYKIADLIVLPAALILFFGRIANYINGELVGKTTSATWCVIFPSHDNLVAEEVSKNPSAFADYCRHPSQLYEAAKNLLIFIILILLRAKKKLKDGILFWAFILMYGILRFIVNFWRDDPAYLGLSIGQYLCIAMVLISSYFLIKLGGNNRKAKSR